MTNEEAIEVINARLREFSNEEHVDVELEEAMKIAVRALENKCHYDGDCCYCSHNIDCEYRD